MDTTTEDPWPPLFHDHFEATIEEEFALLARQGTIDSWQTQHTLKSVEQNPCASIPLSAFDHNYALDHPVVHEPSTQEDDRVRDDEIGRWPRRLLHVPSMTSLEWQPGNIYGDHVAPVYSAVSYTWGRYDLDRPGTRRQRQFKKVKGIEIMGIDWAIPRINPAEQFSVGQFYNLIQNACKPIKDGDVSVEFLWLDVACIDQNDGPQKMAEIGRQAVIFEGAHRTPPLLLQQPKKRAIIRYLNYWIGLELQDRALMQYS
ncbi:MAG: hypothetical protein Q9168_004700 [Polycauliona sp. 1 TL-2023]